MRTQSTEERFADSDLIDVYLPCTADLLHRKIRDLSTHKTTQPRDVSKAQTNRRELNRTKELLPRETRAAELNAQPPV